VFILILVVVASKKDGIITTAGYQKNYFKQHLKFNLKNFHFIITLLQILKL